MSEASSTTLRGVRGTATVVAPATGSMTDSSVSTPAIVVIPQQLFALLVDKKSLDVAVDTASLDEIVVTSTDDTAAGLAACIRVDTLATMLGVEPTEIPDCFFREVWAAEKVRVVSCGCTLCRIGLAHVLSS
jgi:UDP-N-acetylglucosamine transferase subunit ALG13